MTISTQSDLAHRLETVSAQVTAALQDPTIAQRLRAAPTEADWSVMQVLGHMTEMIPYWLHHCQTLIAATEPPPFGRTLDAPERLAGVEHGAKASLDEILQQLQGEVQTAAQTIRQMSEADWGKHGLHNRNGDMTVAQVVERLIVAHAEDHLAQIRTTLSL
jgi:uncharacterized damage-inducible protein DinB